MNTYDKARWQIEGGISKDAVVSHFNFIFEWLNHYRLLNDYGAETLACGIDDEAILTDEMVTEKGKAFLDKYYDEYISKIEYGINESYCILEEMYKMFSV